MGVWWHEEAKTQSWSDRLDVVHLGAVVVLVPLEVLHEVDVVDLELLGEGQRLKRRGLVLLLAFHLHEPNKAPLMSGTPPSPSLSTRLCMLFVHMVTYKLLYGARQRPAHASCLCLLQYSVAIQLLQPAPNPPQNRDGLSFTGDALSFHCARATRLLPFLLSTCCHETRREGGSKAS